MNKVLVIAGVGLTAAVLFAATLIVAVRMRGGVSNGLARVPLVGGLVASEAGAEGDTAAPAVAERPKREATFLRFGPEAKLDRLADELQAKQAEWDDALRELERRARELDAWERQVKEERDLLRTTFGKAQEQLAQQKDELARREADLAASQVALTQAEQANLKQTAGMFGKMDPQKAAEILTTMFGGGQSETVVKLFHLMTDRCAAKVMEAVVDPQMSAQITERLKQVVSEGAPGG